MSCPIEVFELCNNDSTRGIRGFMLKKGVKLIIIIICFAYLTLILKKPKEVARRL